MNTKILRTTLLSFLAGYWTYSIVWSFQQSAVIVPGCQHDGTSNTQAFGAAEASSPPPPTNTTTRLEIPKGKNDGLLNLPEKIETIIKEDRVAGDHIENPSETGEDASTPELDNTVEQAAGRVEVAQEGEKVKKTKHKVSPFWWKRHVPLLEKTWSPREISSWCLLEDDPPTPMILGRGESAEGMIYIKTYKASSSTCEGIAQSIAHRVGQRMQEGMGEIPQKRRDFEPRDITCRAYTRHEFADKRMHSRRNTTHSLLWSFVRNPAARDLSHVYHFEIGRNHLDLSEEDIQKKIEGHIKGRQARYLVPLKTSPAPLWPRHELRRNATDLVLYLRSAIFDNYDFLGLTERMSESLACMVLLWDLKPQDVIVLNSKESGGFDDGGGDNHTCTRIPKPPKPLSQSFQEYFENRHAMWNADVLIYQAANASLERTIDSLGRDRVTELAKFIEKLQVIAHDACINEALFPCSANGTFQPELAEKSCYVQDAGCGFDCVNRVLGESTESTELAIQ